MDLSERLICDLNNIAVLGESDKTQIRLLMLDFFAAMFAGFKQNKKFAECVEKVILNQGGVEESSFLFGKSKIPARSAAFLNSLYGHGAELDDGNKKAMGHVGVHIIPSVLALAEAENKSNDDVLLAIAIGYEAHIRLSSAVQPGMVNRSIHSTGNVGALACAIACAKLLGLDENGMESAMSLACTMSSGLLTYSESQQMIKPINPAKAAETGIFAARLAQSGVQGPKNCLDGPHGWFKAVTDSVEKSYIFKENNRLLLHECYFKLFPSCRHTHCGIEAAIKLHYRLDGDISQIEKIDVYIYPNAIKLAGQIKNPVDADETKFSIHYTLACGLLYGEYGVDYMDPPREDADMRQLIGLIDLISDKKMEERDEGIRGTRIEIRLKNGSVIEETVLVPKGDPENPLSKEDIRAKLRTCARGVISNEDIDHVIAYISSFGGQESFVPAVVFGKGNKT